MTHLFVLPTRVKQQWPSEAQIIFHLYCTHADELDQNAAKLFKGVPGYIASTTCRNNNL